MAILEIELLPEEQSRLRAQADQEGLPLADWARERLLAAQSPLAETLAITRESVFDPTAKPIWEIAAEIGGRIPPEEKARMPHDGSINYKHYLYGSPKVELPEESA